MKKIFVIIISIFLFSTYGVYFFSNDDIRTLDDYEGYFWNEMSDVQKLYFIEGFVLGCLSAHRIAFKRGENALAFGFKEEAKFSKEIASAIKLNLNVANVTYGQLIAGLDEFYKDYTNLKIPIYRLINLVGDRITGEADENKIKERLLALRKQFSGK